MAFSKLNGDEAGIIFGQLCNVFEPSVAVAFSSASLWLWDTLTQALRQQLRAEYEAAVAVCYKLGVWPCKEMREATRIEWISNDISATDLTTLGTLGSVLPALDQLVLIDSSGHCSAAGFDGVQRLAAGLGAGALPSVSLLCLTNMHAGEAGASALAAALGRGALPRHEALILINAGIGDAGLVALAPVLRRLPALKFSSSAKTRSATRASPPSWRRHRRQVRCRPQLVCLRSSS